MPLHDFVPTIRAGFDSIETDLSRLRDQHEFIVSMLELGYRPGPEAWREIHIPGLMSTHYLAAQTLEAVMKEADALRKYILNDPNDSSR